MERIHIVVREADSSGGEGVYSAQLATALARAGHDVTVISYKPSEALNGLCRVHQLRRLETNKLPLLWRLGTLLEWIDVSQQIAELRFPAPDVAVLGGEFFAPAYSVRYPNVPMIYVPHALVGPAEVAGYGSPSRVQRAVSVVLHYLAQHWTLNRAKRTVRFTQFGCKAMRDYYGAGVRPRFRILRPPVRKPTARPASPRKCGIVRLLYAGRLVPSKNVSFLLASLAKLVHHSWTLDVVGNGPERSRLEAQAREHGLAARVKFHGHQQNVSGWYAGADLFVFPSRLESYGLVLVEAMSHGLPCLCIRSDGGSYVNPFDEIISDRSDGFLARNEGDFEMLLDELLRNPELLVGPAHNARRKTEQDNGWTEHVRQYELLFAAVGKTSKA